MSDTTATTPTRRAVEAAELHDLARHAGLPMSWLDRGVSKTWPELERFAALVLAARPRLALSHNLLDDNTSGNVQAQGPTDADRLRLIAHSPSRYVERHPTNGMWRVYEDKALATAVAAHWVAMTTDYHATPRMAIDAAILASEKAPHVVHPRDDEAYYSNPASNPASGA